MTEARRDTVTEEPAAAGTRSDRRNACGIDIHLAAGAQALEALATAHACLDAEERERAGRFVFERDRVLYRAAHALLRRSLTRHAPVAPAAWRFRRSAAGRPEIDTGQCPQGAGLRFNLSHTEGLVCCAICRGLPLGIDAERHRDLDDLDNLAGRVLSPLERQALAGLPGRQRVRRFHDFWTLKEAYLKALGTGLGDNLKDFGFRLGGYAGTDIALDPDPASERVAEGWRFLLLHTGQTHSLAVAAGTQSRVRFRLHGYGAHGVHTVACSPDSEIWPEAPAPVQ